MQVERGPRPTSSPLSQPVKDRRPKKVESKGPVSPALFVLAAFGVIGLLYAVYHQGAAPLPGISATPPGKNSAENPEGIDLFQKKDEIESLSNTMIVKDSSNPTQDMDLSATYINQSMSTLDKCFCPECPSEDLGKTMKKAIYLFASALGSAIQLPSIVGAFGGGVALGGISGGTLGFFVSYFIYK